MPLVSVIMPSYNHGKYIFEAIESMLNQTIGDLELIIVDDGSKDESKQIIEQFRKKDDRVKAFYHEINMGIARTINDCIEKVNGKFIAFASSDDVWVKDKLEKQIYVLNINEDLVVWSEGEIIDAQGNLTGKLFTHRHKASEKNKSGNIFDELLKGNYVFGASRILKAENIGDIRFDESLKYLNDYKFEVDLASKYEYHFIPEPLAMYRIHGANSILKDRENWKKDAVFIYEYFYEKYGGESNKVKSRCLLNLTRIYSNIGEKKRAKQFMIQAFELDPFNKANIFALIVFLVSQNRMIHSFSSMIYRNIKGID